MRNDPNLNKLMCNK